MNMYIVFKFIIYIYIILLNNIYRGIDIVQDFCKIIYIPYYEKYNVLL